MTATLISKSESTPISDFVEAVAVSIKNDNTAQAAPSAGGIQIAGYDRAASTQRHVKVNQNGAIMIGNTAGDSVTGAHDTGATNENAIALFVRAAMTGSDSGLAANSRNVPIEARLGSTDAHYANTLYGLLTNSRMAMLLGATSQYARVTGDTPSAATGEAHTAQYWLRSLACSFGRDTSDNTMRAIEGRASHLSYATGTLYRLFVDSRQRGVDVVTATEQPITCTQDISGTSGASMLVAESRASAFYACRTGRRFAVTTEGTAVTATNGFTATTPRMTIECGATLAVILRRIDVSVLAVGTTNMQIRVVIDSAARYSSGGTAVTLGSRTNMNIAGSTSTTFTAHYGAITATATTGTQREIHYGVIQNIVGGRYIIEFEDGLIGGLSGTILIYIMDAGGTGTAAINAYLEEASVL